jgi:hypothetical protein
MNAFEWFRFICQMLCIAGLMTISISMTITLLKVVIGKENRPKPLVIGLMLVIISATAWMSVQLYVTGSPI